MGQLTRYAQASARGVETRLGRCLAKERRHECLRHGALILWLFVPLLNAQDADDKERQEENRKVAAQLPDGEAKTILVSRCGLCHGLGRVAAGRKSLKSWTNTIKVMVINGATVDNKEIDALAGYLAGNFPEAVNVNSASAAELATVPGIEPPLASSIVAYRAKHGAFATIQDLAAVDGVTSELLKKVSSRLTVGVRRSNN